MVQWHAAMLWTNPLTPSRRSGRLEGQQERNLIIHGVVEVFNQGLFKSRIGLNTHTPLKPGLCFCVVATAQALRCH